MRTFVVKVAGREVAISRGADGKFIMPEELKHWAGKGSALKPAWEPIIVAMKPCEGTFAENALKWGVAGLAIDAGRIGTEARINQPMGRPENCYGGYGATATATATATVGRWPANVLLDEEAAAQLDQMSGISDSVNRVGLRSGRGASDLFSGLGEQGSVSMGHTDSGGASRFFYTAKASPSERSANLQGRNQHPTVKPVDLNRYLASLILPPDRETPRRLLVPFSGSGSEILGGIAAGWDECLGIESDPQWVAVARERIEESAPLFLRPEPQAPVQEESPEPTLFDVTEWSPESTALAPIETGETAGSQPLKILESVPSEAD